MGGPSMAPDDDIRAPGITSPNRDRPRARGESAERDDTVRSRQPPPGNQGGRRGPSRFEPGVADLQSDWLSAQGENQIRVSSQAAVCLHTGCAQVNELPGDLARLAGAWA